MPKEAKLHQQEPQTPQQVIQPRIGVGALIENEQGEVLLVYRNRAPEKDTWSVPGGKVDLYERLEDAVIREVKEEVDLSIRVDALLGTAETIDESKGEHWISVLYKTSVAQGTARNMEEGGAIGDVRWFPASSLPDNLACFAEPVLLEWKSKYSRE
ncbi:DNA mismatch repair protein MutT [Paenibacillus sp. CAA11]|uniref:NUDIX domain-containing protein n=1 Tax=Paenibacillus sp. CAA11 TaxID=1532905 RepID=UPI000D3AC0F3|nr:NUDIX domain-containing protein [Paenibacillus sp. CAA11]AWB43560.1 DNA mismatch repair protein MutT [Paenibacillus sp. CAA11]